LAKHGIKPPISVISNGVELARFTSDSRKKEAFMREFGVADGQKTVIGVGMYFVRKGILDFVDVAKSFPQYRFIWFGYTPVRLIPGAVRKAVRNPPSNVEFPGYISGDVIEGAYENADLFFFPSYEETEGIVVLEALAARQNILVRNIPVYDGWLKNGQNCYMEADTKGFLNTLPRIINGELPSTGRNARASVEDKRLENIGTQLKSVYNKALREYKPPKYK
jgi:1,2-diacylglycerol-3-alpha-glucose alpha-1,2-glucosyltransferase